MESLQEAMDNSESRNSASMVWLKCIFWVARAVIAVDLAAYLAGPSWRTSAEFVFLAAYE